MKSLSELATNIIDRACAEFDLQKEKGNPCASCNTTLVLNSIFVAICGCRFCHACAKRFPAQISVRTPIQYDAVCPKCDVPITASSAVVVDYYNIFNSFTPDEWTKMYFAPVFLAKCYREDWHDAIRQSLDFARSFVPHCDLRKDKSMYDRQLFFHNVWCQAVPQNSTGALVYWRQFFRTTFGASAKVKIAATAWFYVWQLSQGRRISFTCYSPVDPFQSIILRSIRDVPIRDVVKEAIGFFKIKSPEEMLSDDVEVNGILLPIDTDLTPDDLRIDPGADTIKIWIQKRRLIHAITQRCVEVDFSCSDEQPSSLRNAYVFLSDASLKDRGYKAYESFRFLSDTPCRLDIIDERSCQRFPKNALQDTFSDWSRIPKFLNAPFLAGSGKLCPKFKGSVVLVGHSWLLFFHLSRDSTWQAGACVASKQLLPQLAGAPDIKTIKFS